MKKLFIIRHTEAAKNDVDKDRELTVKGKEQARLIAEHMEQYQKPDLFLISTAERTLKTADLVIYGLDIEPDLQYLDELYRSEIDDIYDIIKTQDNKHKVIAIVCHNPAAHQLAISLAARGDKEDLAKIKSDYSAGTTTLIDLDIKHWSDLHPECGRVESVFSPIASSRF